MMSLLAQQEQSSNSSPSGVADRMMMAMSYQDHDKACDLPAMPQTVKSQSIPISGMHRTASEAQLCEDEALADYRDYVVYSRIVQGISRQRETSHSHYLRQENEKCLAHIMSTRNQDASLQSMSHHIAQTMAIAQQAASSDDYFCGEEPPETYQAPDFEDVLAEDDDGIFALEL